VTDTRQDRAPACRVVLVIASSAIRYAAASAAAGTDHERDRQQAGGAGQPDLGLVGRPVRDPRGVVVERVLQQELDDLQQAAGHQDGRGHPAGTAGEHRLYLVGTGCWFDDDG
jgi:hypothetical protein